ncbi:relaxase/mobilization nuclease domain-containing protein [Sphingomonas corticis]|uniref:MobA/VirD2-like nuclease domain-containing protein n=1 Tax=Sphingomonas corticis TaxID=2722791 RepID=A0ABX1CR13_9SPHN|nr:hypothetical protein [Sphingomonas corticis]NJR78760.1 hypothetical protein [Sphingomonas corticis]
MIIKVTRGNDFAGVVDYIARLGSYACKGAARVIALERLHDLRTAAAQLAYDAALDPSRSRPVVHLIARAERGLSDDRYLNLAHRVLKAAGLDGHRFVAAVHDDDGHLHVVASEVDEDGAVPARIHWHKGEKRSVTAEEAEALPRGIVAKRAWDSHLAWRLTRVAREVEIDWNLRRLSSSAKANAPAEPRREQWQKERLARTGKVPLQDRYWTEIRAALALPGWGERTAALAAHGLVIRAHEVGGRVRGLQVHSLTDAQDFVKISAFEMGGMAKLDASAGQPFMAWAAQERRTAISLTKPATSGNPDMIAMQATFKAHIKEWRRREGTRIAAYRQRRRDTGAIDADMEDFANRFRPILTVPAFRQARAEKRRGLKALADARLAAALANAGPRTPQPVFVDFVRARAGTGDDRAARVYRDIAGDVSETRRRALDRVAMMAAELSATARALRERRDRLRSDIAAATAALRKVAGDLAQRAEADTARIKAAMHTAARNTRTRLTFLAEGLAQRLDASGHRIRVTDRVHVDRWQPGPAEREIIQALANRRVFEQYARVQSEQVEALRDDVHRTGAVRRDGRRVAFDPARSGIGNPQVLRWASEPEVVAALREIDRRQRTAQAHDERIEADRRCRDAATVLDRLRATVAVQAAVLTAWLPTQMANELRQASAAIRTRRADLTAREADLRKQAAVERASIEQERLTLLASLVPTGRVSGAVATYLDLWRRAVEPMPADRLIERSAMNVVEQDTVRAMLSQGFTEGALRGIVRDRSPLRVSNDVANDRRASEVLAQVLTDPAVRRVRDEKAAELAERQDRLDTMAMLERQTTRLPAEERWIELWLEILAERPLDTDIPRAERNRSIDHEVAAVMLGEGVTLVSTRSALMRCSPAFRALPSRERLAYVDEQIDALDHVLRRMPPEQRERVGPKPVPARALARMAEAGKAARATWPEDDGSDWVSGKLPGMPPSITDVAKIVDGKAIFGGMELQVAGSVMVQAANHRPEEGAVTAGEKETLFDAAGRPLPHIQALLNGIRQHRGAFKLDDKGRLTAPGQPPEHRKLLAGLLADPQFERLALAAFHGRPNPAVLAAGIGGNQR